MMLGLSGGGGGAIRVDDGLAEAAGPAVRFAADGEGREELTAFQRLERGPSAESQAAAGAGGGGLRGTLRAVEQSCGHGGIPRVGRIAHWGGRATIARSLRRWRERNRFSRDGLVRRVRRVRRGREAGLAPRSSRLC